MKKITFGFAVVILAVLTGSPFSLRADEEKQDSPAVDEAGEKSDAEKSKEQRATLLKQLRSGAPTDAVKSLDAAIEESPGDIELPLMRQQLVSRLVSANMTAQAVEQAEKLIAFQLSRVQDASPGQNMSLASSAQMLSALYQREKKSAEATKITNAALDALRSVGARDESDVYLPAISQLVRAAAQNLAMEEKFAEADEMLKAECSLVQKRIDSAEAIEGPVQVWAILMEARISIARRAALETAKPLADELEAGIRAAIEKKPTSQVLMHEFIRIRSGEVASIYRDSPAKAQELLTNTVEFFNASELRDDKAIQSIVDRLKAYESRIASALLVLEMIGKPAPALDIEAWAHGESRSPDDLKGKVVLLDFWAVWCGPCIATFPHLKEWHEEYHDKGLEIVGVTRQYGYKWNEESGRAAKAKDEVSLESEQEMLDKFMSHHELSHATIITPKTSEMQKQFGVTGIPHAVLLDKQGNVRMIKVGSGPANSKALHEMIEQLLAE